MTQDDQIGQQTIKAASTCAAQFLLIQGHRLGGRLDMLLAQNHTLNTLFPLKEQLQRRA